MAMSAVELEENCNTWSKRVLHQINVYEPLNPEILRLHIEVEKVRLLYQIAMQLARMEK